MHPREGEDGFTLIETLIAIVVMAVAVVAIVSALASMTVSTRAHRGHAVVEAAARSFGQAAQARIHASTATTEDVDLTETAIDVVDVARLPATGGFIAMDRETMKVTNIVGNTLTVLRAQNNPATRAIHSSGARVVPVFRCPGSAELTPRTSDYQVPAGVTPTITAVRHWNPESATFFASQAACLAAYDTTCVYTDETANKAVADVRPECGGGMQELAISVTTPQGAEFRGVDTATTFLVRRGIQ